MSSVNKAYFISFMMLIDRRLIDGLIDIKGDKTDYMSLYACLCVCTVFRYVYKYTILTLQDYIIIVTLTVGKLVCTWA